MKTLADLQLPQPLRSALQETKRRISAEFVVDRIVLFGSVVRGEADEESDEDLLIVLKDLPSHQVRNRITRVLLDINLEFDTNLSELIVDQQTWDCRPSLSTANPSGDPRRGRSSMKIVTLERRRVMGGGKKGEIYVGTKRFKPLLWNGTSC